MLKAIRALWKSGGLMEQAIDELVQMVADVEYVYTHAWEVCTGQAVADKTADPLKEHDKAVNRGERKIRRLIAEHLAINPGEDVSGCLALLIMAKDIERAGDHGRNVYGIGAGLNRSITGFRLFDRLDEARGGIGALLPDLRRAIRDSDEEIAHDILARYQEQKKRLKDLQTMLFASDLPSTLEAVASAYLVRALTRVNAHLGNATTGIIFPIENIDFVSRGLKKEQ